MGLSTPLLVTKYAETVPAPAPAWALETYSSDGSVGRNSLPNGPTACAGKGEPGAAVSRPSAPTVKLSMKDGPALGPTSVPTRRSPVALKRTSPGRAVGDRATVELLSGLSLPLGLNVKPV